MSVCEEEAGWVGNENQQFCGKLTLHLSYPVPKLT